MHIASRILPVDRIDESLLREMHELFSRYYDDADFDRFHRDLAEKSHCIFVDDSELPSHGSVLPGKLLGFSTVSIRRDRGLPGSSYIFSGDTVLDRRIWGKNILQRAFFWVILREKLRAPWRRVYWMLISKGYVTYLMMVRNFPSSYPRRDRSTPETLQRRMDDYYRGRYGEAYDPEAGIISFGESHGSVHGDLAVPKGAIARDPDVSFFVRRNPDFGIGNELSCLAEVRLRDFALHLRTAFRNRSSGRRQRRHAALRAKHGVRP